MIRFTRYFNPEYRLTVHSGDGSVSDVSISERIEPSTGKLKTGTIPGGW
jgi:hypothetical protein